MHCTECIITGRVQGVFFRDFAKQNADMLWIVGEARNQKDNSVMVIAEGERPALEDFITKLSHGPEAAHVSNVSVVWKEANGEYNFFSIS